MRKHTHSILYYSPTIDIGM